MTKNYSAITVSIQLRYINSEVIWCVTVVLSHIFYEGIREPHLHVPIDDQKILRLVCDLVTALSQRFNCFRAYFCRIHFNIHSSVALYCVCF